jgi:hypothetical protein
VRGNVEESQTSAEGERRQRRGVRMLVGKGGQSRKSYVGEKENED